LHRIALLVVSMPSFLWHVEKSGKVARGGMPVHLQRQMVEGIRELHERTGHSYARLEISGCTR
jgi:hypothetical protein